MLCVKIIFCFLFIVQIDPLEHIPVGNKKKIKKLSSVSPDNIITWTIDYALQPADPIAIFSTVESHIDCALMCVKNKHCVSGSYIPKLKLCLLSSAPLKVIYVPVWDERYLHSISTQVVNEDGYATYKTKSLSHGKPPRLCGMNAFSDMGSKDRRKRIIDGYTPEPYHAPWVGLLVKERKARCTAFLVSKNVNDKDTMWALTAKHCFNDVLLDDDLDGKFNTTSFGLLFGFHDLRFLTQHMVFRTISEVIVYPDEGLKPKDLVLIKLNIRVKYNSYINGLCLPDSADDHVLYSETSCTTCGFDGTNMFPKPVRSSNVLQCIKLIAKPPHPNHSLYSDWNSVVTFKSSTFGPYHGDSGSPIFCRSTDPWSFLFAVVTAGRNLLFKSTYLTGARIAYFMKFINEKMNRNINIEELCCPS